MGDAKRPGPSLESAMQAFPWGRLPQTLAGRVEFVHEMLHYPVVNDVGEVEYVQLITDKLARRLLKAVDEP